jgi:choline kinase
MKYIIMCGGEYRDWETPRQLLEIRGEPIVARTIRLLREAGIRDVSISATDPRFEAFGVPVLRHENNMVVSGGRVSGCWARAFYPTSEPACYLMGDVVFSPAAIHKICRTDADGIRFFASVPPFSKRYIKRWAEPFAFKVEDQRRFRKAIEYVEANVDTGIFQRDPISWELWQVIISGYVNSIDYGSITPINDYTCDVDQPEDVARIEEMLCGS